MGEETTEIDRQLREAFKGEWRELPEPMQMDKKVIAIDSGRAQREYALGAFMYICRAVAISSWGKTYRNLTSNSHLMISSREQLSNLISLRSEHLEHEIALQALKDTRDVDVVFLDGSLYGRTLHVPISFDYPGERALYLQYMETFDQLLQVCHKRKIQLLGVSKDSVASHLTKILVKEIYQKILGTLMQHLPSTQRSQLRENFEDSTQQTYRLLRSITELSLTETQRETLRNLITELQGPRPDFALISAWAKTSGYTTPIEPFPDVPFYKYKAKNLLEYVRRRFGSAFTDYPGREEEFEKWAHSMMKRIFNLPTFVTVCVKLAHNDTPLRLDVPAFSMGLSTRISEITESHRLNPLPERITEILQLLSAGYGGLDLYNIWLVRADQEARLPLRDLTTLYEPLTEKELQLTLIPTRRNRRARFGI